MGSDWRAELKREKRRTKRAPGENLGGNKTIEKDDIKTKEKEKKIRRTIRRGNKTKQTKQNKQKKKERKK